MRWNRLGGTKMFEVLHLGQCPGRRRACRHSVLNCLAKDLRRTHKMEMLSLARQVVRFY
jgi:hypothetical protein